MLEWVRFSLGGYSLERAVGTELFEILALEPAAGFEEARPGTVVTQAAMIDFFTVAFEDVSGFEEPHEEFNAQVERGLLRVAEWLETRPPGAFDRCRAAGLVLYLFIGGWLDGEQFDLNFPTAFLLACGRAGVPVTVCTND